MPNDTLMDLTRRLAGVHTDADVALLTACKDAAVDWYTENDVPPMDGDAYYRYSVANLTAWMFDNRGAEGDAAIPKHVLATLPILRAKAAREGLI